MSKMILVGGSKEFRDGAMKAVAAEGHEFLIAKIGGQYYATDNRCTHMGGNLSQGQLEGTIVTCPRHNSQFDLRDGRVVRWLKGKGLISAFGKAIKSPRPLSVYNVKVVDNNVLVEI